MITMVTIDTLVLTQAVIHITEFGWQMDIMEALMLLMVNGIYGNLVLKMEKDKKWKLMVNLLQVTLTIILTSIGKTQL
jgi:hypothetical protein